MSTTEKLIRPRAEVTFSPALGLQPSGVDFSLELNTPPVATLQMHPSNVREDKPTKLLDAAVCNQLARLQERLFNTSATAADTTIKLLDGTTTKLTFSGKLAAAAYQWGFGPPDLPHSVTGGVGALAALDWGAYQSGRTERDKPIYLTEDAPTTDNICAIIKHVTRKIVQRALTPAQLAGLPRADAAEMSETAKRVRTANEPLIKVFEAILDAAPVSFKPLADAKIFEVLQLGISATIQQSLQTAPDGFSALLALCAEFGMVFVPSASAPGRLVRMDALIDGPSEEFKLDASAASAQIGDVGWLPTRCVIVAAPVLLRRANGPAGFTGGEVGGETRSYLQHPLTPSGNGVGGARKRIPPPTWFSAPLYDIPNERTDATPSNSLADVKTDQKAMANAEASLTVQLRQLLKDWARLKYSEDVLRSGSIVLKLPLLYWGLQPGISARFTDASGGLLFTGVVAKVTHGFSTDGGHAGTSLHLSYVRFGSWNPLIE